MKTKKVTITYQATEPKEFIYTVERYYGDGKVIKQVVASVRSLLEWFFDDLDYRMTNEGEFMPCFGQPVYNLKEFHRKVGSEKIERVEITPNPLFI